MRFLELLIPVFLCIATVYAAHSTHSRSHRHVSRVSSPTPRTQSLLGAFPGQAPLPIYEDLLQLNATNGTYLPVQDIQGDILVGMRKQKETFLFFQIQDSSKFKQAMQSYATNITSAATLLSHASYQPLAYVNVAFSQSGLWTLGSTENLQDMYFTAGQYADAATLGDDVTEWERAFAGTDIHGVFLIGSDQDQYTTAYASDIVVNFDGSLSEVYRMEASARPGSQAGHEPFGFLDGISNPAVMGFNNQTLPGQTLVSPGIILTGRPGDAAQRPPWTRDGSFMVFRKLQQMVPEFNNWTLNNALSGSSITGNLTTQEGADLLAARMVGRWKSGAPTDLSPYVDDPSLGDDPYRNNDFDYSHPDSSISSDQSRCPFAAHIRKMNPRADEGNTNTVNHAIRAGTPYGPEVTSGEAAAGSTQLDRGLAFVEYQSNIGNGFRVQQIQWANNIDDPAGKNVTVGIDPIVGQSLSRSVDGLDPSDANKRSDVPRLVISRGGEYFFMPSIPALIGKICA